MSARIDEEALEDELQDEDVPGSAGAPVYQDEAEEGGGGEQGYDGGRGGRAGGVGQRGGREGVQEEEEEEVFEEEWGEEGEEGGAAPSSTAPAPAAAPMPRERYKSRKEEMFLDEAEEEEEEAEEEYREKAKKRKLKKEGQKSGGRLTKVRRRGQTEPIESTRERGREDAGHHGAQGGEGGGNSEDDIEGTRTREDDAFIDDEGVERDPRADDEDDRVASMPQAEEGEEDDVERLFPRGGGGGGKKGKKDDLQEYQKEMFVKEFQDKLEKAAADDAEANLAGLPAIYKLQVLPELVKTLRKKHLQRQFLDRGVFTILKNWLEPLPDWSLPNIKIRTAVLELLGELPIDVGNNPERRRQLKESGLGKVVMFLSKLDKEETMHNRMLAKELVDNWSRPIFEKSTHYRDLREYEADRPQRRQSSSPLVKEEQAGSAHGRAEEDLDDVDAGARSSQSTGPRRTATRIPAPARMDFSIRPESKVLGDVPMDTRAAQPGSQGPHQALVKRMAKMKGSAQQGRILRAEKVSVEGRGMVKYL